MSKASVAACVAAVLTCCASGAIAQKVVHVGHTGTDTKWIAAVANTARTKPALAEISLQQPRGES